jgi:hypothetical protein
LKRAYCAIKLCQAEADANVRNKNCPNFEIPEIFAGDEVLMKRDQSVASKTTNLPWVGPYKVINANDAIVLIQKDNVVDFIHRIQVVKIISRNKDLKLTLNLPTGQKITVTESGELMLSPKNTQRHQKKIQLPEMVDQSEIVKNRIDYKYSQNKNLTISLPVNSIWRAVNM